MKKRRRKKTKERARRGIEATPFIGLIVLNVRCWTFDALHWLNRDKRPLLDVRHLGSGRMASVYYNLNIY